MRGSSFVFLLLLPAIAALGHDGYMFYMHFAQGKVFSIDLLLQNFEFSSLGFLWATYAGESYTEISKTMEPAMWANIEYLLTFKAVFVGLALAGILVIPFLILAPFGKGPFAIEKKIMGRRNIYK